MRIITITIAMFFSLVSTALAEGGKDVAGHPLVDLRKGKQEPKAAAAVPSTGAIVVTGYQNLSSDGNDDVYTVKYAADGSVIWRTSLDVSAGSDQGAAVVIDQTGDAIVAATIMNSGTYDIHVTRYHDNGTSTPTVVWSRTWSGTPGMADNVQTLAYDGAGDRVYVGGYSNNGSNDDYLLLAFDNNKSGDNPPLWAQKFDGSGKDRAYAVAVSADGATIALTGETFNGVDMDMATVMWQNNGTRIGIWPKSGTNSYNDRGTAIAFTPSGNVAVTGYLTNGRGEIFTPPS